MDDWRHSFETALAWLLKATFAVLVSLVALSPARAALDRATITQAGFHATVGVQLPLETSVTSRDGQTTLRRLLDGKPALLVFVDYRCESLCGIVLDRLADVVPNLSLRLGRDYNVVSIALDERQTQDDARAFRDQHVGGTTLAALGRFVTEDRAARDALERSVGLVAPYDVEHQRFAHPAGIVAIDGAGRLKVVLSPFALDPRDIKLALTQDEVPRSLMGQILRLCYGYNAVTGVYDVQVERILAVAAAATIVLMVAGLAMLLLVERRSSRSKEAGG